MNLFFCFFFFFFFSFGPIQLTCLIEITFKWFNLKFRLNKEFNSKYLSLNCYTKFNNNTKKILSDLNINFLHFNFFNLNRSTSNNLVTSILKKCWRCDSPPTSKFFSSPKLTFFFFSFCFFFSILNIYLILNLSSQFVLIYFLWDHYSLK